MRLPHKTRDMEWIDRQAIQGVVERISLNAPPPKSILPDGWRQAQCELAGNGRYIGRNRTTDRSRRGCRPASYPQNNQISRTSRSDTWQDRVPIPYHSGSWTDGAVWHRHFGLRKAKKKPLSPRGKSAAFSAPASRRHRTFTHPTPRTPSHDSHTIRTSTPAGN
jgi:hypothetical protein